MRHVFVIGLALLLAGGGGALAGEAKRAPADFSGEWILNPGKSGFEQEGEGRRRQGSAARMTVRQDEKELVVIRVRTGRDGEEREITMKYSLEGKKTKNKTEFGTSESTARWLDEGGVLELVSYSEGERRGMKFSMETVQTWSLDGGVLTIETVRSTPRGEMRSTAVYEREGTGSAGEKERDGEE